VTGVFDITVAHPARIYDYWLGGKDNYAADRDAAEQAIAANPGILADVRANRAFLARAVGYLSAECGIRQFLDIGTGLPTANNTHEVAQSVAPDSRIVYVDNDPIVLLHARELLTSSPRGATDYLDADLRETSRILAAAARTLDFSKPAAVMMLIVLHLIPDADDPFGLVAGLMDSLAPGSYLVISHAASDVRPAAMAEMTRRVNARLGPSQATMRSRAQIMRFFDGLELVEPGIVQPHRWRPAGHVPEADVTAWCGMARKA
jgi:S-adenosyl methyltransferase